MPIRFTPIKFPLKMRGVDIRNLDDLRKNFDLNAAVEYFRNGKLIQWLKARYHNDEAEKVAALSENTPDFRENLCAALGVNLGKLIEINYSLDDVIQRENILCRETAVGEKNSFNFQPDEIKASDTVDFLWEIE